MQESELPPPKAAASGMSHREGALVPVLSFLILFPIAGLSSGPPQPGTAPPSLRDGGTKAILTNGETLGGGSIEP
jgi:hypothetical protein